MWCHAKSCATVEWKIGTRIMIPLTSSTDSNPNVFAIVSQLWLVRLQETRTTEYFSHYSEALVIILWRIFIITTRSVLSLLTATSGLCHQVQAQLSTVRQGPADVWVSIHYEIYIWWWQVVHYPDDVSSSSINSISTAGIIWIPHHYNATASSSKTRNPCGKSEPHWLS